MPQTVVPVYVLSRDFLEFLVTADDGRRLEPVYGAADIGSRIDAHDSERLIPGELTGQEVLFSPLLPEGIDYIYGLTAGCYRLQATLNLHSFSDHVDWARSQSPVEGAFSSSPEELCIAPPSEKSIRRFRSLLSSNDFEEVIEALNYFANVPDTKAAQQIRQLAGDPRGWMDRIASPFHVLAALRVQTNDDASRPYFQEALGTRYDDLARKALQDIDRNN